MTMSDASSPSLWARLRGKFSRRASETDIPEDQPAVGNDGLLSEAVDLPPEEIAEPDEKPPGPLARWTKRDATLSKLQEGYEQVTRIVEQTQQHLADQSERGERICVSLDQLAGAMTNLSGNVKRQANTLETIASQMVDANAHTHQMSTVIKELPNLSRAQNESLAGINQQLHVASEQNLVATQTLDKLGSSLQGMGDAARTQTQALRDMNTKSAEQNNRLAELLDQQNRRFMMLFVVTVVLAVLAVGIGIISLVAR